MTEPPKLRHNTLQTALVFAAIPTIILIATVTYPRVFMACVALWIIGGQIPWRTRKAQDS